MSASRMPGYRSMQWLLVLALACVTLPVSFAHGAPDATPVGGAASQNDQATGSLTVSEYDCPPGTGANGLTACIPAAQSWDVTVVHGASGAKFSTLSDAVAVDTGAFTFKAIPAGDYTIVNGDPDGPGKIEVLYAGPDRDDNGTHAVTVKPGSESAFSIYAIPPEVAGTGPEDIPLAYRAIDIRPVACVAGTDIDTIVGIMQRQTNDPSCDNQGDPAMDVLVTHLDSGREWSMRTDNVSDWAYSLYIDWLPGGEFRLTPISTGSQSYLFLYYIYPGQDGVALTADGLAYVTLSETDAPPHHALIVIFCVPVSA